MSLRESRTSKRRRRTRMPRVRRLKVQGRKSRRHKVQGCRTRQPRAQKRGARSPIRHICNSNFVPPLSPYRLNDHFHETRSKTARHAVPEIILIDCADLSYRSSSSSVVCLGSYHKIPEVVDLVDNCDNCDNSEAKAKPVRIRSSVKRSKNI